MARRGCAQVGTRARRTRLPIQYRTGLTKGLQDQETSRMSSGVAAGF
jgi:hypothetical protein